MRAVDFFALGNSRVRVPRASNIGLTIIERVLLSIAVGLIVLFYYPYRAGNSRINFARFQV